jgi:membrane protease YdiL (CAAX protease family)
MPRPTGWRADLVAIVCLLIVLNLTTGYVLDGWIAGAVQISAAVIAVFTARRRGYTRAALGLDPEDVGSGLRLGGAVAALIVAGVSVAALVPFTRGFFDDERFVDVAWLDVMVEVVVRIPVVTALGEELLFRSVLLAVLLAGMSRGRAVAVSSLLFGLWHVLTTIADLDGNEATDDFNAWEAALGVTGVVAATGLAGAGFCWLRLRSGSLAAPWLVHTVLNASTYLAGAILVAGGHV